MINYLQHPHIIIGSLLSLLLACLLSIFFISWQWRADWQIAHHVLLTPTHLNVSMEQNDLITTIPNQHLFGKPIQGTVPVSNLQLQINGIVVSTANTASKAYISIAGAPSKIYRIGDQLPLGVKIYKIQQDTVIFDNAGQYEKLSLARSKLAFKSQSKDGFNHD